MNRKNAGHSELTALNVEEAIRRAFVAATRSCGIGGPALTITYAFGVMLDRSPFPATGLRHWAKILVDAADRMEGVNLRETEMQERQP